MEEELHEPDGLTFGQRHLDHNTDPPNDVGKLDTKDFKRVRAFSDDPIDDHSDIADPEVRESLDLERAYRALAEHRPDLLHPSVFKEDSPQRKPPTPSSAAAVAMRAMDARERILTSVADFGPDARSAALSVLAGTPPEALVNPLAVDLISNFAIGEAVRQGKMISVSGPLANTAALADSAGFTGVAAFESIFGPGQFSESERMELRAAGL